VHAERRAIEQVRALFVLDEGGKCTGDSHGPDRGAQWRLGSGKSILLRFEVELA
jgi:hypothetical protein